MIGVFSHTVTGHERGSKTWIAWLEKFGIDPKDVCADRGSVIEINVWRKTISYTGYVRDENGEVRLNDLGRFLKIWKTVKARRRPIAFPP